MLTEQDWVRHLSGKTPLGAAEQILGNLTGYRKTSLRRADDTTQLALAIGAILSMSNIGGKLAKSGFG